MNIIIPNSPPLPPLLSASSSGVFLFYNGPRSYHFNKEDINESVDENCSGTTKHLTPENCFVTNATTSIFPDEITQNETLSLPNDDNNNSVTYKKDPRKIILEEVLRKAANAPPEEKPFTYTPQLDELKAISRRLSRQFNDSQDLDDILLLNSQSSSPKSSNLSNNYNYNNNLYHQNQQPPQQHNGHVDSPPTPLQALPIKKPFKPYKNRSISSVALPLKLIDVVVEDNNKFNKNPTYDYNYYPKNQYNQKYSNTVERQSDIDFDESSNQYTSKLRKLTPSRNENPIRNNNNNHNNIHEYSTTDINNYSKNWPISNTPPSRYSNDFSYNYDNYLAAPENNTNLEDLPFIIRRISTPVINYTVTHTTNAATKSFNKRAQHPPSFYRTNTNTPLAQSRLNNSAYKNYDTNKNVTYKSNDYETLAPLNRQGRHNNDPMDDDYYHQSSPPTATTPSSTRVKKSADISYDFYNEIPPPHYKYSSVSVNPWRSNTKEDIDIVNLNNTNHKRFGHTTPSKDLGERFGRNKQVKNSQMNDNGTTPIIKNDSSGSLRSNFGSAGYEFEENIPLTVYENQSRRGLTVFDNRNEHSMPVKVSYTSIPYYVEKNGTSYRAEIDGGRAGQENLKPNHYESSRISNDRYRDHPDNNYDGNQSQDFYRNNEISFTESGEVIPIIEKSYEPTLHQRNYEPGNGATANVKVYKNPKDKGYNNQYSAKSRELIAELIPRGNGEMGWHVTKQSLDLHPDSTKVDYEWPVSSSSRQYINDDHDEFEDPNDKPYEITIKKELHINASPYSFFKGMSPQQILKLDNSTDY